MVKSTTFLTGLFSLWVYCIIMFKFNTLDGMVADTLVGRRSWTVDDDDVQADITVMIGGSH